MNFISKCPYCNNAYQAEEAWNGQVMSCPTCGKQIVIQREEENTVPPPKVETKFTSRCPYCGGSYQADESGIGKVMNCPTCGKSIVIQREEGETAPQLEARNFVSRCPYCGGSYLAEKSKSGQIMGCPICGKQIVIQRDSGTQINNIASAGSGEKLNEFPVAMLALPIIPATIALLFGSGEMPWWGYPLYNTFFVIWDMKILSRAGYNKNKTLLWLSGLILLPLYLGVRANLTKRWRWFVLWIISFFAILVAVGLLQTIAKMAESGQIN